MPRAKRKSNRPRAAAKPQAVAANAALERIWAVVAAIPPGSVSSYGEVAVRAGLPGRARLVGRALKVAPRALKLPWHRVLSASGRPAFPAGSSDYQRQCRLLRRDGVALDGGRVVAPAGQASGTRAALDALLWNLGD